MKKYTLMFSLIMVSAGHNATAALVTGDVLAFGAGGIGSYFAMDFNNDGLFTTEEHTEISMFEGIRIGVIQPATDSHSGAPDGPEMPGIDNSWGFLGATGMHFTTTEITEVSPGVLDFTGWSVNWNRSLIAMGGDPLKGDTGLASITCSPMPCAQGSSFSLDYLAHVPGSGFSGKGGTQYALHLEGQVNAVPVPAAVWLFGSGLIGLAWLARHYKAD